MDKEIQIRKTFPINRIDLFQYFIQPELLEQWAYPDGMTLKIPVFVSTINGTYRFEHSGKDGKYVAVGHLDEFVPGERLSMTDESIKGPDGKVLAQNLICIQDFKNHPSGTEVIVTQRGFSDERMMYECRVGWEQCLEHLRNLIERDVGSVASI